MSPSTQCGVKVAHQPQRLLSAQVSQVVRREQSSGQAVAEKVQPELQVPDVGAVAVPVMHVDEPLQYPQLGS